MSEQSTFQILYEIVRKAVTTNVGIELLSKEDIIDNVNALIMPPKVSTVRLNKLCEEPTQLTNLAFRIFQQQEFVIRKLEALKDIVFIDSVGPFDIKPKKRRVIVSVECAQAVLRGSHVFAPGILAIENDPTQDCHVSVWADLESRCTRGYRKRYDRKTQFIANGLLMINRDQLFKPVNPPVRGVAIEIVELEWRMPSFDLLPKACFFPQNLPSFLAVLELDVIPGMKVLDMCASPGGKASHIAAQLDNIGELVAIDKNPTKVTQLIKTLSLLNVTCAKIEQADSTTLLSTQTGLNKAVDFQEGSFDRILLDPPCSGLGQRPLLTLNKGCSLNSSYSCYQRRLLAVAIRLLKPGGLLVYSTCTITVAENECNILHILENNDQIELVGSNYPEFSSPGLPIQGLNHNLVRRFWPASPQDTIGFFYAKLRKCVQV